MCKLPFAAILLLLSLASPVRPATIYGSDRIGELRLVDGPNRCQGRLEIRPDSSSEYGQACDSDPGRNEARVICRQLNCLAETPTYSVVPATNYRSEGSINVFRGFGYVCNGDEASITRCRRTGSSCSPSRGSIGIQCGPACKVGDVLKLMDGTEVLCGGITVAQAVGIGVAVTAVAAACLIALVVGITCYKKGVCNRKSTIVATHPSHGVESKHQTPLSTYPPINVEKPNAHIQPPAYSEI